MKHFNERHEVIITTYFSPVDAKKAKDGDVIPHSESINDISFYHYLNGNEFTKIVLSKEFILDVAEQIKKIQSNVQDMEYSPIPF